MRPRVDLLGGFEQLVLLALVALGDTAYGVSIAEEISARTGRRASLGSVYKTLDRLETKGYVSASLGAPTPERGGRGKKFFRVEPAGLRTLRRSLRTIDRMTTDLAWLWRRP
jgi:DNA-binding PadR family transcriptional regulator